LGAPVYDELPFVVPVVVGQPRNTPGGVLTAAPGASAPSAWFFVDPTGVTRPQPPAPPVPPPMDEASKRKLAYAARLEEQMTTRHGSEPWRGFTAAYPMPIFNR
jgi:hypothetical protein